MTAPLIHIEAVAKRFGTVVAVDDVSLTIGSDECVALLGPSGCGKTTLLRLVAGLERADAGSILIDGSDVTAVPPYGRPVNMMFQSYALFPHMSVAGNVAFGLRQDGLRGETLNERVREALAAVEMEALAERRPEQLSGGQRQRVALARCIAKRPKALLLDEPMAALDKNLRARTQTELMALRARLGISFVIVTHDQDEAMAMADRIAVMDKGRILQVDTPRGLYEHPASHAVARFFGDVNVWRQNGEQIAVRPERIVLSRDAGAVRGAVTEVAYRGTMLAYLVRLGDGTSLRVVRQNDGTAFQKGEAVFLSWPAEAVLRTLAS